VALFSAKKLRKLFSSRREDIIEDQFNQIKRLECKYRNLYEGAPDMYRTINRDGIIVDCNQSYVKGLGYVGKAEIIGRSILEHTAPDSIDAMKQSFEEWRSLVVVTKKEIWFKRKNGSTFPVLLSATNLYDDNGNLVGSNTAIVDATQICEARRQLQKANQLQEEFIKIAAHELRTPIQPILGLAELATSGTIKHEQAVEGILKEARRLTQVTNAILDVSRMQNNSLTYEKKKVKVNELITEMITSTTIGLRHKFGTDKPIVAIETELDDDVELELDKGRIIQALSNIVGNSVKFSNGGRITIRSSAMKSRNLFEIRIIDGGIGLSEEILPLLFDKFVTKAPNEHFDKMGAGLGLYIARSIIQAHGGHILAGNNTSGKGCTFVVRLPISGK
jgi:PAS domain S-box-containing protein